MESGVIVRNGLGISHIFFADDILLFAQAKASQMNVIMQVLTDFVEAFSGLRMNASKSKALASKSTSRCKRDRLAAISGIPFANSLGRYLGFNLVQGRAKRADFQSMLDRVKSRLCAWKGKLLNKAGRVTLVKAVITSILTYVMQTRRVPGTVCEELDAW